MRSLSLVLQGQVRVRWCWRIRQGGEVSGSFGANVRRDSGANFVVVGSKRPVGPSQVPRVFSSLVQYPFLFPLSKLWFVSILPHPIACMPSSVLRPLIVYNTDLHSFVTSLRDRLGPQIQNVPFLYEGAPELKDMLHLFDIKTEMPAEILETNELRARFQSLVEGVFAVLAETRQFVLFLDGLHGANAS